MEIIKVSDQSKPKKKQKTKEPTQIVAKIQGVKQIQTDIIFFVLNV